MSRLFQAYREWKAARTYRQALRFFEGLKANARRLHAPTRYIEAAQREWLHRALRGGDA